MSLATISSVVVQYGNRIILDGVNLTIQVGDRIGLLGRNGTGKSTLLNVLTGSHDPDSGSAAIARGSRVGLLEQHPTFEAGLTVRDIAATAFVRLDELHVELERVYEHMASADGEQLEQLMMQQSELQAKIEAAGGWSVEHRIEATLHGVGLGDEMFDRDAMKLSGGERSRLALAKLLLEAPDLLLLDEPTNHLDIEGCEWLERFLRDTFSGAVIVVSHDRWLLDAVCDKIVELRRGLLEMFPGNYTQYVTMRAERRLTESRMWEKQQDHIRREQVYIRKYKAGQRAKQARGRETRLERFVDSTDLERPESEVVASMRLPPAARCGDRVLSVESLRIELGGRCLVSDLNLDIRRGDRIGIVGPNGSGKTTLLRVLLEDLAPTSGHLDPGTGLHIGWFRQMQDHVDPELSVWEWVQRALAVAKGGVASEQEARDLAGAFLFTGADQDRLLGTLSGGERARAVLAGLFGGGHNMLVLDEPSNHVDLATAERLEAVLRRGGPFGGTLLMVSHDRALLESTCDQLVVLDGLGTAEVFKGTIARWITKRAQAESNFTETDAAVRLAPTKKKSSPLDRLSLADLEAKIEQIESRLSQIQSSMGEEVAWSDPAAMQQLVDEQQSLTTELEAHEQAWVSRSE